MRKWFLFISLLFGVHSMNAQSNRTFTVKGVSFTMIYVKGGTFRMGATSEQGSRLEIEKPVHSVTLDDYLIGQTEVTRELWSAVMGVGYYPDSSRSLRCPEDYVTWYSAQRFIQRLNSLTGQKFRLPTEAEWEYAARGGQKSRGYKYSGSNNPDDVAWYNDNSVSRSHVVATKSPNELGIYDMSGNLWEWCQDWYDGYFYRYSPQKNPQGPSEGYYRVKRGGSYDASDWSSRSACRSRREPKYDDKDAGLRLAL